MWGHGLVEEGRVRDECGDKFGDEFIVGGILSLFCWSETDEDVAQDFTSVAEAVLLCAECAFEVAGEHGEDALIDVEVDLLVLVGEFVD